MERNSRLGARAVQRIKDAAVENRSESERNIALLRNDAGAVGTITARTRWANMWKEFIAESLNFTPGQRPSGDDFLKFLSVCPSLIDGKASILDPNNVVPSHSSLVEGLQCVLSTIRWEHQEWRLEARDSARIKALFSTMLREGKITKDPKRDKTWLTAFYTTKMCTALALDALRNGCHSWDAVIVRLLHICLPSACAARVGDVCLSTNYSGKPYYLRYEHVAIRLLQTPEGDETLIGEFHLNHCKGQKDEPQKNKIVRLRSLPASHNVCDPIKLVLILALRIGAVAETSVLQLLQNARKHNAGCIVWKRPELPVLPEIVGSGLGAYIRIEAPSVTSSALTSIRKASDLLGIKKKVNNHDTRRGAAKDFANMQDISLSGAGEDLAARALGHNHQSMSNGTTELYIGALPDFMLQERVLRQPSAFENLEVLATPYKPRMLRGAEVDSYCESNGLDKQSAAGREQARRKLKEQLRNEWASGSQTSARVVPSTSPEAQSYATPSTNEVVLTNPGLASGNPVQRDDASSPWLIDPQLGRATGIRTHSFPTSTENITETSDWPGCHSPSGKRQIPEFTRVLEMGDVLKDAAVLTDKSFAYPEPELALRGNVRPYEEWSNEDKHSWPSLACSHVLEVPENSPVTSPTTEAASENSPLSQAVADLWLENSTHPTTEKALFEMAMEGDVCMDTTEGAVDMNTTDGASSDTMLHMPLESFMDSFARINEYLSTSTSSKTPIASTIVGGSRDPPILKVFECGLQGCNFRTPVEANYVSHTNFCGKQSEAVRKVWNHRRQREQAPAELRIAAGFRPTPKRRKNVSAPNNPTAENSDAEQEFDQAKRLKPSERTEESDAEPGSNKAKKKKNPSAQADKAKPKIGREPKYFPNENGEYECPHAGCGTKCNNSKNLCAHIRRIHDWTPQRCTENGCTETTTFQNYNALSKHKLLKHKKASKSKKD
ncbi:hypothetical protein HBI42_105830 [Parastagonospora nodorum]|nr:hypothetical protein HBI43_103470 [Parastagonospora nodorum]KAH6258004.1 hypothetical protein HBI42_105830 [Parastagonospora nodorum]